MIAAQFRSGAQIEVGSGFVFNSGSEMGLPNRSCRRALAPARSAAAERGSLDPTASPRGQPCAKAVQLCPVGRHHRRDGRQWRRCHLERRRREWRDDQQGRHREGAFRRICQCLDPRQRRTQIVLSAGTAFVVMVKGGGDRSSPAWPTLCSYPLAASRTSAAAAPPRPSSSAAAPARFSVAALSLAAACRVHGQRRGVEIANPGGTTSAIAALPAASSSSVPAAAASALRYLLAARSWSAPAAKHCHAIRSADGNRLQRRPRQRRCGQQQRHRVCLLGRRDERRHRVKNGRPRDRAGGKAVGATLLTMGRRSSRPAGSPAPRLFRPAASWKSTAAARVGATILSGGMQIIRARASVGLASDGGIEREFLSGGADDNGIVSGGGRIVVGSGGTAIDVTISGGAPRLFLRRVDHADAGGRRTSTVSRSTPASCWRAPRQAYRHRWRGQRRRRRIR